MAMNVGASGGVKSDINITPLVDVVLVLLIIFMISVPLLQMGYPVQVPPKVEAAAPPPTMQDQVIVRMDAQGQTFINKQLIPRAQFGGRAPGGADRTPEQGGVLRRRRRARRSTRSRTSWTSAATTAPRTSASCSRISRVAHRRLRPRVPCRTADGSSAILHGPLAPSQGEGVSSFQAVLLCGSSGTVLRRAWRIRPRSWLRGCLRSRNGSIGRLRMPRSR